MLYNNNDCASYTCTNFASPRDPYWLTCGWEVPGHGILWSQPEIVLYDKLVLTGTSGTQDAFTSQHARFFSQMDKTH